MIRAKSADGIIHQFPDGTDDQVIDRVMKDYAQSLAPPDNSDDDPSMLGAGARGLVRGAIPAAGGYTGAVVGAGIGGAFGGPAAPLTALAGAVIGGFGGGYGMAALQEKALGMAPEGFKRFIGQDEETRRKDYEKQKLSSLGGEIVAGLPYMGIGVTRNLLRPGASMLERVAANPKTQVALGAGIGGAQQAGMELAQTGEIDPWSVALAAGAGSVMNRPTRLGRRIAAPINNVFQGVGLPVGVYGDNPELLAALEARQKAAAEPTLPGIDTPQPIPVVEGETVIERLNRGASADPAAPPPKYDPVLTAELGRLRADPKNRAAISLADQIEAGIDSGTHTPTQSYMALHHFGNAVHDVLGGKNNDLEINLVSRLLGPDGGNAQGVFERGGGTLAKGLIEFSMNPKQLLTFGPETGAHEIFHALQESLKATDPKAYNALKRQYNENTTLASLPKGTQSILKSTLYPDMREGARPRTVWDVMVDGQTIRDQKTGEVITPGEQNPWGSGEEAQAHVEGALHAIRAGGVKMPVREAPLQRYSNTISEIGTRLKNGFTKAGFQTADDVLKAYAGGKAGGADPMALNAAAASADYRDTPEAVAARAKEDDQVAKAYAEREAEEGPDQRSLFSARAASAVEGGIPETYRKAFDDVTDLMYRKVDTRGEARRIRNDYFRKEEGVRSNSNVHGRDFVPRIEPWELIVDDPRAHAVLSGQRVRSLNTSPFLSSLAKLEPGERQVLLKFIELNKLYGDYRKAGDKAGITQSGPKYNYSARNTTDAEQSKSVFNRGTYDPQDPRYMYSKRNISADENIPLTDYEDYDALVATKFTERKVPDNFLQEDNVPVARYLSAPESYTASFLTADGKIIGSTETFKTHERFLGDVAGGDLYHDSQAEYNLARIAMKTDVNGKRSLNIELVEGQTLNDKQAMAIRRLANARGKEQIGPTEIYADIKSRTNGENISSKSYPSTKVDEAIDYYNEAAAGVDKMLPYERAPIIDTGPNARYSSRQINTPEFKNWFGASKVVNKDGSPIVLYHGTSKDADFKSFKVGRHGAWFTTDPAGASQYAIENDSQGLVRRPGGRWEMDGTNTASRVIPVYVKIENPYRGDIPDKYLDSDKSYKVQQSKWFDELRAKGYDGWMPDKDDPWGNGRYVVALKDPTQIKSVFNRGTYDPNDPRYMYSKRIISKAGEGDFYSPTLKAVLSQPGGDDLTMTGDKWGSVLSSKMGKLPSSVEWRSEQEYLGLKDFLSSKPEISRKELATYIKKKSPTLTATENTGGYTNFYQVGGKEFGPKTGYGESSIDMKGLTEVPTHFRKNTLSAVRRIDLNNEDRLIMENQSDGHQQAEATRSERVKAYQDRLQRRYEKVSGTAAGPEELSAIRKRAAGNVPKDYGYADVKKIKLLRKMEGEVSEIGHEEAAWYALEDGYDAVVRRGLSEEERQSLGVSSGFGARSPPGMDMFLQGINGNERYETIFAGETKPDPSTPYEMAISKIGKEIFYDYEAYNEGMYDDMERSDARKYRALRRQVEGKSPPMPFKDSWRVLSLKTEFARALADGKKNILFPTTPEQVARAEKWGERFYTEDGKHYVATEEGRPPKNVTTIVKRALDVKPVNAWLRDSGQPETVRRVVNTATGPEEFMSAPVTAKAAEPQSSWSARRTDFDGDTPLPPALAYSRRQAAALAAGIPGLDARMEAVNAPIPANKSLLDRLNDASKFMTATTTREKAYAAMVDADYGVGKIDKAWAKKHAAQLVPGLQVIDRSTGPELVLNISSYKLRSLTTRTAGLAQADMFSAPVALTADGDLTTSKVGADGMLQKPVVQSGKHKGREIGGLFDIWKDAYTYGVGDVFHYYMDATRATRLMGEGREKLFTPADTAIAKQLEQKFDGQNGMPNFKDMAEMVHEFNVVKMDGMVKAGAISRAGADKLLSTGDYASFYREYEKDGVAGPVYVDGVNTGESVLRTKLKGSDAKLADPLERWFRHSQAMNHAMLSNESTARAINQAVDLGVARKAVVGDSENIINVRRNGDLIKYVVDDPMLHQSLASVDGKPLNAMMEILRVPTNILRKFTTSVPTFPIMNAARDSFTAFITGDGKPIYPLLDAVRGYNSALKNSASMQALANHGITGNYDYIPTPGKNMGDKVRRQAAERLGLKIDEVSGYKDLWRKLSTKYEKYLNAGDAAVRTKIYDVEMAKHGNPAEAAYQAGMKGVNFQRRGSSQAMSWAIAAFPFLNARIQGTDLIFRTMYNQGKHGGLPGVLFSRGMAVAAMTAAYYLMMRDNEVYKKASSVYKDGYWIVPLNIFDKDSDEAFVMPIPFEAGVVYKNIPEHLMRAFFGDDRSEDLTRALTVALTNTLKINPIPQAVLPLAEAVVNYSTYTGRAIVPEGQKMPGAEKYEVSPHTSLLARTMGKATNYSPIKIDHLMRGYFGTVGEWVTEFSDVAGRGVGAIPPIPDQFIDNPEASNTPFLKRFVRSSRRMGNEELERLYSLHGETQGLVRTINRLKGAGDGEAILELYNENKGTMAVSDMVNGLFSQVSKLNKMQMNIQSNVKMSAPEKDRLITMIEDRKYALSRQVETLREARKNVNSRN